jgi:hypothetical protein
MRLFGFSLSPRDAKVSESFSLSLFWRGSGGGTIKNAATIFLRDSSNRGLPLTSQLITLAPDGRGTCTLFDLRVPSNTAIGAGSLIVNDVELAKFIVTK